ncbi:MAG: helix-turn-helix domain-containing protein [Ekhidna sp.]|uniref:helix-turn-helix domain-containing protein n=1 Tax=Ekhidna sp. TaxID=2608089 RepID=UPI0032EE9199
MQYLEGAVYLIAAQLLVCAILNLRSKSQSNRILGLFLLVMVDNIRKSFIPLYIDDVYLNIFTYNIHSDMLYGPLMFLYLKSKTQLLIRKDFFGHLTLPIIYNLGLVLFMLVFRFVLEKSTGEKGYINLWVTETRIITFLIYLYLSFQIVKKENWNMVRYASRFQFFFLFFGSYCVLYYTNIFMGKYAYIFIRESQPTYAYVSYGIFLLLMIFLVFYGATEVNWLKSFFLNSNLHHPNERQYVFEQIKGRIDDLFEVDKIHLNDQLSLSMMASKLEVRNGELSDYLLQVEKTNFYDYVNTRRIEEFKSKLTNPKFQHLDMLGIAYESGFQSKATFNRAFKKHEKVTPREYKSMLTT